MAEDLEPPSPFGHRAPFTPISPVGHLEPTTPLLLPCDVRRGRPRAARAQCDCGLERKGKAATRAEHRRGCHYCRLALEHKEWVFSCGPCGTSICQSCALPGAQALRLAAVAAAPQGSVLNGSEGAAVLPGPPSTSAIDAFLDGERQQADPDQTCPARSLACRPRLVRRSSAPLGAAPSEAAGRRGVAWFDR